jgi:hypothetical protein
MTNNNTSISHQAGQIDILHDYVIYFWIISRFNSLISSFITNLTAHFKGIYKFNSPFQQWSTILAGYPLTSDIYQEFNSPFDDILIFDRNLTAHWPLTFKFRISIFNRFKIAKFPFRTEIVVEPVTKFSESWSKWAVANRATYTCLTRYTCPRTPARGE